MLLIIMMAKQMRPFTERGKRTTLSILSVITSSVCTMQTFISDDQAVIKFIRAIKFSLNASNILRM